MSGETPTTGIPSWPAAIWALCQVVLAMFGLKTDADKKNADDIVKAGDAVAHKTPPPKE